MSNSKLIPQMIRQGDVLAVKVPVLRTGNVVEPPAPDGSIVLAHGEVTGHRHRFEFMADAKLFSGGPVRQVEVVKPATLLHEEHTPPVVGPGIYDLPKQVEWTDANEPRAVAD